LDEVINNPTPSQGKLSNKSNDSYNPSPIKFPAEPNPRYSMPKSTPIQQILVQIFSTDVINGKYMITDDPYSLYNVPEIIPELVLAL